MDYDVVRKEIESALAVIGEKHGFTVNLGAITYNDIGFHATVTAKNKNVGGKSGDQIEYEVFAHKFDIDPTTFGKYFSVKGEDYQIIGLNKKARAYPVVAINVNSKVKFKFPNYITKIVRDER